LDSKRIDQESGESLSKAQPNTPPIELLDRLGVFGGDVEMANRYHLLSLQCVVYLCNRSSKRKARPLLEPMSFASSL
jgi:hypothetical protein